MKSRAAIGNHPVHPALVAIPIGAFFMALIGDIAHATTHSDFWYQLSFVCIGVGVLTALLAALLPDHDLSGIFPGSSRLRKSGPCSPPCLPWSASPGRFASAA